MTDYATDAVDVSQPSAWPLTPFVRVQLAAAAVLGPAVVGLGILLPVAGLALLFRGPAAPLLSYPAVVLLAVSAGAILFALVMPRVWPAARSLSRVRRTAACILGPATANTLGLVAVAVGKVPTEGSMDPAEVATTLACTLGGVGIAWLILRQHGPAQPTGE